MKRSSFVPVLALLITAGAAEATTHVGIISTERSSPRTSARLNAAGNNGGAATFTVFPAGAAPISDTLDLSSDGKFVSSASSSVPEIQNLFTGSGSLTALVRVDILEGGSATLEQSSTDGKIVLALPPIDQAASPRFQFPVGDLQQGTVLLIGNPNPSPNSVVVRVGQSAPEPARPIAAFGVLAVEMTVPNTLVVAVAQDPSLLLVAQLAVDTGRTTVMTYLPSSIVE
jgi:hypothetical protein